MTSIFMPYLSNDTLTDDLITKLLRDFINNKSMYDAHKDQLTQYFTKDNLKS